MVPEVLAVRLPVVSAVTSAIGLRIRWLSKWCSIDRPIEATNAYLFTGGGCDLATQVAHTQT
jgi:hypothetical protein